MFRVEKCKTPPPSLVLEKEKANGSYKEPDVVNQLKRDFFGKCYVCELKDIDPEVEHLRPHKNGKNIDLKFDWENLFYSCGHCNSVKTRCEFDNTILDCTKEDILHCICYKWSPQGVEITPQDDNIRTIQTAKLISDVFNYKNTALRTINCENRYKSLTSEINNFMKLLLAYKAEKSEAVKTQVIAMLSRESAFSAFKKWLIMNNSKHFSEFAQYIDD